VAFDSVELTVWHPPPEDWERQRVRDDDSLVMELAFGRVSIVLTGDIGATVESALARRSAPSPLRILKVPHHGSASSSSTAFLEATRPRVAVISVGRGNPFGHPADSVVERYRAANAIVFRTDRDGAVMLETDGSSVWIRTHTGGSPIRLP
jgi:competence protein ComEC